MRLVVSLTTIPSRIRDIEPTLYSITRNQTRKPDRVYLTLPKKSSRDGEPFLYDMPDFLLKNHFDVEIVCLEQDMGPASKVFGGLIREADPDTAIVICDDDIIYGPTWLQELEQSALIYKDAAIGFGGLDLIRRPPFTRLRFGGIGNKPNLGLLRFSNLEREPGSVCSTYALMGVCGVLFRRRFFPDHVVEKLCRWIHDDPSLRCVDDITLNAAISTIGVPRLLLRPSPALDKAGHDRNLGNALSATLVKAICLHIAAFSKLETNQGAFSYVQNVVIWIVLVVVLFMIMLVFFLKRMS